MRNWIELAKESSGVFCKCGMELNMLELEEYGKCLFCIHEEEDEKEAGIE